jgi:hypothetical protein
MSHEEKNTIFQIIIGVVVNIWILYKINNLYKTGAMDDPNSIQIWAETIFWIIIVSIAVGVVFTIIGTIIFSILESIIMGQADSKFMADERDKMIGHTGNRIIIGFVGAGFLVLITGIKFGYETVDCLVVLMFCFSLGSLFAELAKLARYRMSF